MALYFIGFHIEHEAGEYVSRMTKDIVDRFNLFPLHLRVPPHVTFFPPFECKNLFEFHKKFTHYIETMKVDELMLDGAHHFGTKTIYFEINASEQTFAQIEALNMFIKAQEEVIIKSYLFEKIKLHASVARHITEDQFTYVWQYINSFPPQRFTLRFDHVALFVLTAKGWKVGRKYYLPEQ